MANYMSDAALNVAANEVVGSDRGDTPALRPRRATTARQNRIGAFSQERHPLRTGQPQAIGRSGERG